MNTFDAIRTRRAVKAFDPDHRLTAEEETQLLEATIQAPTSFNIQHWRFVVLRDPELRARIRKELGLFANLRPATVFPALADASTL